MKLGDVKIEALRLMLAGADEYISRDMLGELLNNEAYRGYLMGMTGSINRCISRLEDKRVLPSKVRLMRDGECSFDGAFIRFDLDRLVTDFFDIDRLIRSGSFGEYSGLYDKKGIIGSENFGKYEASSDYFLEGSTLVIEARGADTTRLSLLEARGGQVRDASGDRTAALERELFIRKSFGAFMLVYKPRLPRITEESDDEGELPIPNNIAAYIPHFIKGELYRDDEPAEAAEAMNWFEEYTDEIVLKNESKTGSVKTVYSLGEW